MEAILQYVSDNISTMKVVGKSSNEIHIFTYNGRKCIVKTPLMTGNDLSPFWEMMKNLFGFTFEKQILLLPSVYEALSQNPHIPYAPLLAADETAMVYGFMEGKSWDEDEFPQGGNNAYRLGQFIGFNHRTAYDSCGLFTKADISEFFGSAEASMARHIERYWKGDGEIERKVRSFYKILCSQPKSACRNVLQMIDQSADQYLYDHNGDLLACVDMDAYVIAPDAFELTFLKKQVSDWEAFRKGYEEYLPMPDFDPLSDYFTFLMNLNAPWDKEEMAFFLQSKF